MDNFLFLDIESNGTSGHTGDLLLAGWALDDGGVVVTDFEPGRGLTEHLANPGLAVVSHTPFDPKFFEEAGFEVAGPLVDTKTMAWVLNENTPLDLDWLLWKYCQVEMDKRLRRSAGRIYFETDAGKLVDLAAIKDYQPEPNDPESHDEVWDQFRKYNRRDVVALRKLFRELLARLEEQEWRPYWEREEVPYTRVLTSMEHRGLPVDLPATAELAAELEGEVVRLRGELLRDAGLPASFNLNSQPQLVAYLFGRVVQLADELRLGSDAVACLKSCLDGEHEDCVGPMEDRDEAGVPYHIVDLLPAGFTIDKVGREVVQGHWTVKGRALAPTPKTINKKTGEEGKLPSTSSPELLYMHAADDWVRKLCTQYRKTEKLLNTYLRKFPLIAREDEAHVTRIYGRYNQTGTVTGRLSSSGPNMQNMPARGARGKAVRALFALPESSPLWLVVADYDQLEMRIMAHMSEDKRLVDVFRRGDDPHEMLAVAIFGDVDVNAQPRGAACSYRDAAKTLNYAMGYGAGRKKVAQTLSLVGFPTTPEMAQGYLDEMAQFYRGLFRWKDKTVAQAKSRGHVATLGGRRRRLRATFRDTANWKMVGYGERQAVNAKVQGTAADIIRRAMIEFEAELREVPMLAQVHDELVFQTTGVHISGGVLHDIKSIGETAHGFDLLVPLVFTPHVGKSWAAAKAGADINPFEEADEDDD